MASSLWVSEVADLGDALVLETVYEADVVGAAGHGGRLVVRGIADAEAVAGLHVALGVVAEGGVDQAAGDGGDTVRPGLSRRGVAVRPHVRLGGEVADDVVGEGLVERGRRQVDGRGNEPVQAVVAERLRAITL